MPATISLPEELAFDLDTKVNAGEFASRDAAAAYFIRLGLQRGRPERRPLPPGIPPPYRDPGDDRPISIDPADVNWAERA